jgi:hypothetical protein
LNQLAVTKNYCEKRINFLGGPDYRANATDEAEKLQGIPGRKVCDGKKFSSGTIFLISSELGVVL